MLEELKELLKRKRSKQYYADQLGITISEVEDLLLELRGKDKREDKELNIEGSRRYNLDKGEVEIKGFYDHPPEPSEIIKDHNIDETKWKLSSFYSKSCSKGWAVTALFKSITPEDKLGSEFIEFLKGYESSHEVIDPPSSRKDNPTDQTGGILLLNKQDAHLNKHSVEGPNDIFDRFKEYYESIISTVEDAFKLCNLEKIIYVIGSDQFNSEWTNLTTKGTPQQNILPYHVGFQLVCRHEVKVINTLLSYSPDVEVVYLGGNHDKYVSWNMVSWLQAYYRNQPSLSIDLTTEFTKFRSFYDSAVCLNHGDAQKQSRLATNFPILYKEGFSKANHYYVITGDKHVESTEQYGAIKCYQIPVQSKAISEWDARNGYNTSPAEVISFLFQENKGIKAILREPL